MKHGLLLAAAAATLLFTGTVRADDPDLVVLDWAGLDIPGAYAEYKDKNGDKPTYAFFGSDDEAFQKVSSGFKADVVEPCSQMVSKYREAGLIEPWDSTKIPRLKDIDPRFMTSKVFQDDKGVWFIPTNWGVTAVIYNTKEVPVADVASLQVFADPKYAGRISIPNSSDDVWALAYLATGVTNWDNITDDQFNAAAAWLRKVHPSVRAYWNDTAELQQLMSSGEVLVGWGWNDAVAGLKAQDFPVAMKRDTKEGYSDWYCGYVKVKGSPGKPEKAYDFINSWLNPQTAPALIEALGYGHTNKAAMEAMDPAVLAAAGARSGEGDDIRAKSEGPEAARTPAGRVREDQGRVLSKAPLSGAGRFAVLPLKPVDAPFTGGLLRPAPTFCGASCPRALELSGAVRLAGARSVPSGPSPGQPAGRSI